MKEEFKSVGKKGITPAYTGKSGINFSCRLLGWDHPRIHGEKICRLYEQTFPLGSPPHTRGKVALNQLFLCLLGITPAYTGKSSGACWFYGIREDHPRIHGEKKVVTRHILVSSGSPPHTRGKVSEIAALDRTDRITPAYTGKRLKRSL